MQEAEIEVANAETKGELYKLGKDRLIASDEIPVRKIGKKTRGHFLSRL